LDANVNARKLASGIPSHKWVRTHSGTVSDTPPKTGHITNPLRFQRRASLSAALRDTLISNGPGAAERSAARSENKKHPHYKF
jgi:hypothetical protein